MTKRKPRARAPGEGSVYRDPVRGTWYAAITLENGKPMRRRAKTQQAGLEKLAELKRQYQAGITFGEQPTLWQWWQLWLELYAKNLKPNIRADYLGVGRRYVQKDAIGRRKVAQLTNAHIQDWVDRLAARVSPQTVRNAHARLHKCLKVAIQRRYRVDNPSDTIDLPESRPTPIRPLQEEQALRLLDHLADDRWYCLYRLLLNLGLREGEALGLTWDKVDLTRGTIRIDRQLRRVPASGGGKEWALQSTKKAASDRTMDLDDDLIAVLRAHRQNWLEEKMALRKRWTTFAGGELLFVTSTGQPIHASSLLQHLHASLEKAGVPKVRVHDLRHTAACLWLDAGITLVTVSKLLGHADVSITAKTYAHALDKSKASAVKLLSERLGKRNAAS